jgi:hypothetical protein
MPQTCSICRNPHKEAVDAALISGKPYRHIASHYGTSTGALQRHRPHISEALTKAKEAQEAAHGEDLLSQVQDLVLRARGILNSAKDQKTALVAVRELRGTLELLGKVTGELQVSAQFPDPRPMFILSPGTQISMSVTTPDNAIDVTSNGNSEDVPS